MRTRRVIGAAITKAAVRRLRFVLDQPADYDRDIEGIASATAPTAHAAAVAEQGAIRAAEVILKRLSGSVPTFRIAVGCRGRVLAVVAFCHVRAD